MNYDLENDYDLYDYDQNSLLFMQPYEDLPQKKRKTNDDLQLNRYSLIESTEQRKHRMDAKREERKNKIQQCEKSTTDQTSSEQPPNKQESRKIKNRNSAQLSRDRKKAYLENLIQENSNMKADIQSQLEQIAKLQDEVEIQTQKIVSLQELRGIEGPLMCPYCERQVLPHQQSFQRVVSHTSSRSLKTYGLLSLFLIVTMLGCMSSIAGPDGGLPVHLLQIRQNSQNSENFFTNGAKNSPSQYEPFQVSPMEITTLDQMRQLKNFQFKQTDDPNTLDFKVNLRALEEKPLTSSVQANQDKTLFLNCTASVEKCNTVINVIQSQNINDIHLLNNPLKQPQRKGFKQYHDGQILTILQVADDDERFMMNSVTCRVQETSNVQLANLMMEKMTL